MEYQNYPITFDKLQDSGQSGTAVLYSTTPLLLERLLSSNRETIESVFATFEHKHRFNSEVFRVDFYKLKPDGTIDIDNSDINKVGIGDTRHPFQLVSTQIDVETNKKGVHKYVLSCVINIMW